MRNPKDRRGRAVPCARLHDDDIPARDLLRLDARPQTDRKTRQLCREVYKTLSVELSGRFGDEVLQDLAIASVDPAPDASRLLVSVYLGTLRGKFGAAEVMRRLLAVHGVLRHEVAAAVQRKRAPELLFRVVDPGEPGEPASPREVTP